MEQPKLQRQIYRAMALENYTKQASASAEVEVTLSLKVPKYFWAIGFMGLASLIVSVSITIAV